MLRQIRLSAAVPATSRRVFFASILAATLILADAVPGPAAAENAKSVTLVVDFGDGFEKRYTRLPVGKDQTVLDMLVAASKHPRSLKFKSRGAKATAFVTEIDGVANEGAGRNWVFRVNGKLGKRSCGVSKTSPGDVVTWRFERYKAE